MSERKQTSHVRTIKLKTGPEGDNSEEKIQNWRRIRQISADAWRAANWIASGQYLNDYLIRKICARKVLSVIYKADRGISRLKEIR